MPKFTRPAAFISSSTKLSALSLKTTMLTGNFSCSNVMSSPHDDRLPDRARAYATCSVAVDLNISQLVGVPNMLVSAFLPENISTD